MTLTERLVAEYDAEMDGTRKLLALIPEGKTDWRPHPNLRTIGELGAHIAQLVLYATDNLRQDDVDFALSPKTIPYSTTTELLARFDKHYTDTRVALAEIVEEGWNMPCTMRMGEKIWFTKPRYDIVTITFLNHLIHHRGQLTVYLRLLDVPIPGLYGMSADDKAQLKAV